MNNKLLDVQLIRSYFVKVEEEEEDPGGGSIEAGGEGAEHEGLRCQPEGAEEAAVEGTMVESRIAKLNELKRDAG